MATPQGTLRVVSDAVRQGRVSAREVVRASIERLEDASELNVLAESCFDEALARAELLDTEGGPWGPLAGVPILIKDLEDLAGHATRKGSLALRDAPRASGHGVVPGRLLAAGAVAVGKSTLPEFAIEGYTANLLTGVTRNPWNPGYSPGGSSGGSAAAVAAGLVGAATATDGGGSVRIPASLCGLVGIKPTNGVIGRWPAPDWIDLSTDGPFATTTDDLRLLLEVMAGPVAGDPSAPPAFAPSQWRRHDDRPVTLLAAERTSPLGPLEPEVAMLFRDGVAAVSEQLQAPVRWLEPTAFFLDGDPDLDWFTTTSVEHVSALGRDWVEAHMSEFHVATQEFLTTGLGVSVGEYLAARRRRYLYVRALDELLGDNGVLLTPTVASSGWLADGRLDEKSPVHGLPPRVYSTAMQNIVGNPAISVPFGRLPAGIPFGLQLTAPHWHDHRLIDLAALVERSHPWPRVAPGYEPLEAALDLA